MPLTRSARTARARNLGGGAAQQKARDDGPQYTATATVLYADELVINLRTAKALGLTIPPSLLLRADLVIE